MFWKKHSALTPIALDKYSTKRTDTEAKRNVADKVTCDFNLLVCDIQKLISKNVAKD